MHQKLQGSTQFQKEIYSLSKEGSPKLNKHAMFKAEKEHKRIVEIRQSLIDNEYEIVDDPIKKLTYQDISNRLQQKQKLEKQI